MLLKVRFNYPEASFFIIKRQVPHLVFTIGDSDNYSSWYVSLSNNLKSKFINLDKYRFNLCI